ncbi:metallophosphoesterase 1 isoform X1 [Hyalella azteca]|uniref:Metallophosphoesterase 1 isoform X1 n=1 Tax=Hyalella azteca TaxID=294128 RepID=A0A979FT62_HYAAZ|nr:metallophosphoesterase 1 isoform X1 [Hyalella azteca]
MRAKLYSLKKSSFFFKLLAFAFVTFLYCEFLHYYTTIFFCTWPDSSNAAVQGEVVRTMVVADTHLLGSRNGHWFDKLRREWQMHRAFQTAVFLHSPDLVIFLGDLFDEGKWCSTEEFSEYVKRFSTIFALPNATQLIVVAGNHDIGFHYSINPALAGRFEVAFRTASVSAVSVRGVLFVGVNSMAMHGDDCFLCADATKKLKQLHKELQCRQGAGPCDAEAEKFLPADDGHAFSRPVLLQHYPLYRESDKHCDGYDAAPPGSRDLLFRERWECLSQQASQQLLSLLQPQLVLSGHTHHGCTTLHMHPPRVIDANQVLAPDNSFSEDGDALPEDAEYAAAERDYVDRQQAAAAALRGEVDEPLIIPEYSVPSFSWRNKKNPTFAMVSITADSHGVYRCEMPREQTVVLLYCASFCLFLLSFVRRKLWWLAPVYNVIMRRAER